MKKTKSEAKLVEIEEYYCDECEELLSVYCGCIMCGGDFCGEHTAYYPLNDPSDDYPDYVCLKCNELVKPYIKIIKKIEEKYDSEREELIKAMKKTCKNSTATLQDFGLKRSV